MSGTGEAAEAKSATQDVGSAEAAEAGGTGGLLDLAEEPGGAKGGTGGERPSWLPEQFWDAERKAPRVEQLAKSVTDLRGQLAKRGGGVPETAEAYRLPEVEGLAKDAIKPDDPLWSAVRRAAHEAGISQAQLEAIARPYLAEAAKAQGGQAEDKAARDKAYAEELQRLGPNGRQVLGEVKTWVDGLVGRGMLAAEERAALYAVSTADGVRALAKLRSMAGEKPIPVEAIEDGRMSLTDAQRLMEEALRKRDPALGERAAKALRELSRRG